MTKNSRSNSSQTQASDQSSQSLDVWVNIWTPPFMSQPTPPQSMPSGPPPASTQPITPTRRPLDVISGNSTQKRPKCNSPTRCYTTRSMTGEAVKANIAPTQHGATLREILVAQAQAEGEVANANIVPTPYGATLREILVAQAQAQVQAVDRE
jgi:hypothetical protein